MRVYNVCIINSQASISIVSYTSAKPFFILEGQTCLTFSFCKYMYTIKAEGIWIVGDSRSCLQICFTVVLILLVVYM